MNYNRLIRNWHARAGEGDYFSKFVFEYLAFVAYLKTNKYPSMDSNRTVTDRDAIQELKRDKHVKIGYLGGVKHSLVLKRSWQKIKAELKRVPLGNVSRNPMCAEEIKWWNCSHKRLIEKTDVEKNKSSGVLHSLNDWENMVEFWYSIRNNLFHGGKDPERKRDQFGAEFGYKTLRELMTMLLRDQNSL